MKQKIFPQLIAKAFLFQKYQVGYVKSLSERIKILSVVCKNHANDDKTLSNVRHDLSGVHHGLPRVLHGFSDVHHGLSRVLHGFSDVHHGLSRILHGFSDVLHRTKEDLRAYGEKAGGQLPPF